MNETAGEPVNETAGEPVNETAGEPVNEIAGPAAATEPETSTKASPVTNTDKAFAEITDTMEAAALGKAIPAATKRSWLARLVDRLRPRKKLSALEEAFERLKKIKGQSIDAKTLPTRYRDSGQLAIQSEVTFSPDVFAKKYEMVLHKDGADDRRITIHAGGSSTALKDALDEGREILSITPINGQDPTACGRQTVYTSFKPNRVVVSEMAWGTFSGKNLPDVTMCVSVDDGSDCVLNSAFSGSIHCFPNAPGPDTGIHCVVIKAGAIGVGLSWPTVNAGIPVTVSHTVLSSVLRHFTAPAGYDPVPRSITVRIFTHMFGPQLR